MRISTMHSHTYTYNTRAHTHDSLNHVITYAKISMDSEAYIYSYVVYVHRWWRIDKSSNDNDRHTLNGNRAHNFVVVGALIQRRCLCVTILFRCAMFLLSVDSIEFSSFFSDSIALSTSRYSYCCWAFFCSSSFALFVRFPFRNSFMCDTFFSPSFSVDRMLRFLRLCVCVSFAGCVSMGLSIYEELRVRSRWKESVESLSEFQVKYKL